MSRVLCIGDLHEDVRWAQLILQKETDFDKLVWLGDEFDAKSSKPTSGIRDTCQFMVDRKAEFGDKMICLMGNHLMPYAYMLKKETGGGRFYQGNFNPNKLPAIKEVLGVDFFDDWKLAHYEDEILYSHAGARPEFLYNGVEGFIKEADEVAKDFRNQGNHRFFDIGRCRGGTDQCGGLTWRDWRSEWSLFDNTPQVVGHTADAKPRKKGNSFNIDCKQTFYAIIEEGAFITFKNPFDNQEIHDTFLS